jgi:hypothetical protein
MRHWFKFCAAFAVLLLGAWAAPCASAIGYWNIPGNFCQWWGYGNGPGYHAPMVLGPVSHQGWHDCNLTRLPYPPKPANYCNGGCGGDANFGEYGQPTVLEAQPTPAAFLPHVSR